MKDKKLEVEQFIRAILNGDCVKGASSDLGHHYDWGYKVLEMNKIRKHFLTPSELEMIRAMRKKAFHEHNRDNERHPVAV